MTQSAMAEEVSEAEDLVEEDLADSKEEDLDELTYSLSDLVIWEILLSSLWEGDLVHEQAAALAKVRIFNYHLLLVSRSHIMVSPNRSTMSSIRSTPMVRQNLKPKSSMLISQQASNMVSISNIPKWVTADVTEVLMVICLCRLQSSRVRIGHVREKTSILQSRLQYMILYSERNIVYHIQMAM